jgi:hypothetical protein
MLEAKGRSMPKKRQYVIIISLVSCLLTGAAALVGFLLFLLYMSPAMQQQAIIQIRLLSLFVAAVCSLGFLFSAGAALIALLSS